jgi:hypothetical protein
MALRKSSQVSKPITSPEELERLKEEKRQRNRLNKQRAKAMERRIAKYLGGDRTPQSGAGSSKGDVTVLFANRPGRYLIECKLTEQFKSDEPNITLSKIWLSKIQAEAKQMNALFGLLVFRYHFRQTDYVLIRATDLAKLNNPAKLDKLIAPERLDFNNPKAKTISFGLAKASLATKYPEQLVGVTIDYVLYYLTTLVNFKELIDSL